MGRKNDERIKLFAKFMKGVGLLAFAALNTFMIYNYTTAFSRGHARGQQLAKKQGSRKYKSFEPLSQEMTPQYMERQSRRYKGLRLEAADFAERA